MAAAKLAREIDPRRVAAIRRLAATASAALRRGGVQKEAGFLDEAVADLGTARTRSWLRGLRLIVGLCHPRWLGDTFPPGMGIEGSEWLALLASLDRRCRRLIRELE